MRTKLSIFSEKLLEAGWLAAVVSVPLYFNIYTARTFEPDKITLLRSIVAVMILAWLIMVVEQGFGPTSHPGMSVASRFRRWLKQPLVLPTLLLVLVYLVSTVFSLSPNVSVWGSYQRLQGTYSALSYIVIFALMASYLRSRSQVDRLVTTIIITSVPVSLYGVVQRYGLDPLPWAGNVTTRVASNMGNPIFVASYLIMIVPLTLSRLIEAMTAIIKDKEATWGYTILAAVYIFILAIQILTILFSGSRGPLLGLLGAGFVIGLLVVLILRQLESDASRLSLPEIGRGILFTVPLSLVAVLGGGAGYVLGRAIEGLLPSFSNLPLLGAALGSLLGFVGLYTFMAASKRGWRWLWLSWVTFAVVGIAMVVTFNIRGTALDTYLDPIRDVPYVSRLGEITITESGTGKVRVLIWDAALELIAPHEPLGIEADGIARRDSFNFLRPLLGYGPESMFNAFAFVYPPDLAHVEVRGSSADRSHNETVDSLVITGVLGFLAFYYLMISLFYYVLVWLGWAPDQSSRRQLLILLILGGIIGALVPYIVDGKFTFALLGLPFGLVTGMVIHLIWMGLTRQKTLEPSVKYSAYTLLFIGVLGAIVGHFIEVHFVFSIAATYAYFWIYLGLLVGLSRIRQTEVAAEEEPEATHEVAPLEQIATSVTATRRSKKKKRSHRRAGASGKAVPAATQAGSPGTGYRSDSGGESWENWMGSQGLTMAIILIILTFDFITPQFQFSFSNENSRVFFWMLIITWLAGFAIALSVLAIRSGYWRGRISWGRAILLYSITSLSYFFFYSIAHSIQFGRRVNVQAVGDVLRAAEILSGGLIVFYIFLLLLMVIIAITLSWGSFKKLPFWRAENWWLYPPLVLAVIAIIWFKNIDVVRADIYLKEGERYRTNRQWSQAIALHEKARALDFDEDFYYLMLALDYQLMAQDNSLEDSQRQYAWQLGEQIALEARGVNPYNPDNTGNMGRYYFTLGQIFNPDRFQDALDFFEKATILAPSNIIYHNLWAQTNYILQDYDTAVDRLQTSVAIDSNFAPTWILLGDTYAAMGDADQALLAHGEAIKLNSRGSGDGFGSFADQFLDQRLNFYISAGRAGNLIARLQQLALERADEPRIPWVIGHLYNLMGQTNSAVPYYEEALALGDKSSRTVRELANIHLAANSLEQALPLYHLLLESNPDDVESNSALAFIYAQQGQLDQAIQYNLAVVERLPNDYDSLKNLAILYQQSGQLQEALLYAEQAQAYASDAERPSWSQFAENLRNQLNATDQ
jgi:tetratricopeptide (TPR) repeat protein